MVWESSRALMVDANSVSPHSPWTQSSLWRLGGPICTGMMSSRARMGANEPSSAEDAMTEEDGLRISLDEVSSWEEQMNQQFYGWKADDGPVGSLRICARFYVVWCPS